MRSRSNKSVWNSPSLFQVSLGETQRKHIKRTTYYTYATRKKLSLGRVRDVAYQQALHRLLRRRFRFPVGARSRMLERPVGRAVDHIPGVVLKIISAVERSPGQTPVRHTASPAPERRDLVTVHKFPSLAGGAEDTGALFRPSSLQQVLLNALCRRARVA